MVARKNTHSSTDARLAERIERSEALVREAFLRKVNRALRERVLSLRLAERRPSLRRCFHPGRLRLPVPVIYDAGTGAGWLCMVGTGRNT